MNKRQLVAASLSAALLAGALPGLALAQDEVSPEAIKWTLTSLAGDPVPEGVEPTLFLSGGEVTGNAGCNSYFGSYVLDGESLTFPEPFGVTSMFCEGAPMDVEDAYLPLLQETASWSMTGNELNLADADGAVQLTYVDQPVEVTETDIAALDAALADLQTQIDEAAAEVAALTQAANEVNLDKIRGRIAQNEEDIAALQKKTERLDVNSLRRRIGAVETSVTQLNTQVTNLGKRVNAVEKTQEDHEKRISAIEEAYPVPEPL